MSFLDNSGVEKLVSLIKSKIGETFASKSNTVSDVDLTYSSLSNIYGLHIVINGTQYDVGQIVIPYAVDYKTTQSLTSTQQATARSNIGVYRIVSENISVAASAWTLEQTPTYANYPYRASITVSGATSSMFPEVIFSPDDAASGNYAPVASTTTNTVYIYAKAAGAVAITIPSIIVH